ncbi:hypothetical protein RvY_13350 [Ramazzottius varieornatus]|uniref:EamA domain-containing protein n=1 Tax=Ramazzottius varieornatus TaxID=947166 RepID=A0A1D1VV20_RAMVA|nr:hypothetical protein RvY_13350 [Ramazzottius varieornatus]
MSTRNRRATCPTLYPSLGRDEGGMEPRVVFDIESKITAKPPTHTQASRRLSATSMMILSSDPEVPLKSIEEAAEVDPDSSVNSLENPTSLELTSSDSPNSASTRKYCTSLGRFAGILLGLFSGFTNSLIGLLVKLADTRGVFEISTYRFGVMLIPPTLLLIYNRLNPLEWKLIKTAGWLLFLRGSLGAAAEFARYFALKKLPLADASVIMYSSPVFVAVFGRIFLKEPFRWSHAISIIVTLTGCILVSRPPAIFGSVAAESSADWYGKIWGYVSALGSAMFAASAYVAVRYMKDLNSHIVLFHMGVVGVASSAITAGALKEFGPLSDPKEIGGLFGVGLLSWLKNETMVRALQLESAGLIALLRTGDIVWAFIWQIAIFRTAPHYLSIIGAVLVVACVSFLSISESLKKLPADSKVRHFVENLIKHLKGAKNRIFVNPPKETASTAIFVK